jgi:small subunit ribosomal protein S6
MAQSVQNYETLVILNPALPEDDREALVGKLRNIVVEGGADLKHMALWGKRRLAYPIDKRTEGYYVVFYFQSVDAGEILVKFEKICRFDENVMRQMSLKVPTRKKGQEVTQVVPSPGWLANFKIEPRSGGPRRRPDMAGGPPRDAPPRPAEDAPKPAEDASVAVADAPPPPEAPASEAAATDEPKTDSE